MFRVLGFLSMKDGMEMQEFIDYYEHRHVPLICSLAPTPIVYKRRTWFPEPRARAGCETQDAQSATSF